MAKDKILPKKSRNPNPPPKPQQIGDIAQYLVEPVYISDAMYGHIKFDLESLDKRLREPFVAHMDLFARRFFFYELPIFDADFRDAKWMDMFVDGGIVKPHVPQPPFESRDKEIYVLTKKGINYARNYGNPYPLIYDSGEMMTAIEVRDWLSDRLVANGKRPVNVTWVYRHSKKWDEINGSNKIHIPSFNLKEADGAGKMRILYDDISAVFAAIVNKDLHANIMRGQNITAAHRRRWARESEKAIRDHFDPFEAVRIMQARITGLAPEDYEDCGKCDGVGYINFREQICNRCFGLGKTLKGKK